MKFEWKKSACGTVYEVESRGRKARLMYLILPGKPSKWELALAFFPRIYHGWSRCYDIEVRWSVRMCPTIEQALVTSERILEQEWTDDI
jgi:hypothetical protein